MTLAGNALLNSRCAVSRLHISGEDGAPQMTWMPVEGLQFVSCRFDVGFLRPGKDVPMAVEAGKAPPRFGVLYAVSQAGLLAGDRVTFVDNDYGQRPVSGTFELRVPPDEAQDYFGQHHIEVQIIEVAIQVINGERRFPGGV